MEKYYTTYTTTNSLGRWLQADPLADKFAGVSPYNYCLNNPLRLIDLFGFEPKNSWVYNSETGLYQVSDEPVIVGERYANIDYSLRSFSNVSSSNPKRGDETAELIHQTGNKLVYASRFYAGAGLALSALSFYPPFTPFTLPLAQGCFEFASYLGLSAIPMKFIDVKTGLGTSRDAISHTVISGFGYVTSLGIGKIAIPDKLFISTSYGSGFRGLDGKFVSSGIVKQVQTSNTVIQEAVSDKIIELSTNKALNVIFGNQSK